MFYSNKNNRSEQHTTPGKLDEIIDLFASKTNCQPKLYGKGYRVRCTAHNDKNPSLCISEGYDGRVLLKCFTGCLIEAICDSIGIKVRDLFPKSSRNAS